MKCKQATQLMSQSQDRDLTLKEKIQLKLHLLMCDGCTHCNRQMSIIRAAVKELGDRK